MKINWFILLIIFQMLFGKEITFGDKQIIIMLNQYFEKSNSSQLLGHHFFNDKNDTIFQIEIEMETENFNIVMVDAFRVINKLSNIAKTKFTQSIVIVHFRTNNLPIIAKSELGCSKDFFIYKTHNEALWRQNCLSIQKN